ncbi:MAG: endonuclease/exonuclease/phosphatase family protein [Minicystis sp.]
MPARPITTWNVLHRVHAINWDEPAILQHPDERTRIARIADLVATWCVPGAVIGLQEVSGDQLAALRARAPAGARIFAHAYPRVPRLRAQGAAAVLADPREHLVVIACDEAARVVEARTFGEDPGKGLLAVALGDGGAFICTHVSFGDRRTAQLQVIGAVASAISGMVVVAGDFNATLADVRGALGAGAAYADVAGQPLRTRRGEGSAGNDVDIDHVIVLRGEIEGAAVIEDGWLSDHRPVRATVWPRSIRT